MSIKGSNKENTANLLISRIFHDLGNCVSLLNFFVEINKEDPSVLDFNELVEINSRMLITLRVLQYMFLPMSRGPKALTDIEQYLDHKGKKVIFHSGVELISEKSFILMLHSLLLLSKLVVDHAKIDVVTTETGFEFNVVHTAPVDEEKLALFESLLSTPLDDVKLTDHCKSHVCYIKDLLLELGLQITITFAVKKFTLCVSSRN